MKTLDIVVPCYNEEEMLQIFYKEVSDNLKNIKWNVIFVNDGSNDNTLEVIKELETAMIMLNTSHFQETSVGICNICRIRLFH